MFLSEKMQLDKTNDHIGDLQIGTTLAITLILVVTMLLLAQVGQLMLALLFSLMLGFMVVRLFILQHDCAHASLFAKKSKNRSYGIALSLFTLTPFHYWRRCHLLHHGTTGNASRRGYGDIFTYKTTEYESLSLPKQFAYRLARHPIILTVAGSIYYFIIKMRNPMLAKNSKELQDIVLINFFWVTVYTFIYATDLLNWQWVLLFHVTCMMVAGSIGLTLFFVQHNFEGAYWRENESWNFKEAALHSSSNLRLPAVVSRFFCYINLHHVHHLQPGLPNYLLANAFEGLKSEGIEAKTLHLCDIPRCFSLKLIDDSMNLVPLRKPL